MHLTRCVTVSAPCGSTSSLHSDHSHSPFVGHLRQNLGAGWGATIFTVKCLPCLTLRWAGGQIHQIILRPLRLECCGSCAQSDPVNDGCPSHCPTWNDIKLCESPQTLLGAEEEEAGHTPDSVQHTPTHPVSCRVRGRPSNHDTQPCCVTQTLCAEEVRRPVARATSEMP